MLTSKKRIGVEFREVSKSFRGIMPRRRQLNKAVLILGRALASK